MAMLGKQLNICFNSGIVVHPFTNKLCSISHLCLGVLALITCLLAFG